MMTYAREVLDGNRLALSRLLTKIENNAEEGWEALDELFPFAGNAHLIGITGAPGTGKSTLVNALARQFRNTNEQGQSLKVGIVAVDPSSPFTGGAILGDRVRMRDLAGDPGIFIRSMATRGSLGGLAATTSGIVQALDAAGFEIILIETVGAGQAEVDIARLAHTTLVVEAPGLGDDIQAIKAGILEIADILVINKADRPGVEATERALQSNLQLAHPTPHIFTNERSTDPGSKVNDLGDGTIWIPPIQKTIAVEGKGITDLIKLIYSHRDYLQSSDEWQRREKARLYAELHAMLKESLLERWFSELPDGQYQDVVAEVYGRQMSPWKAVKFLLRKVGL
jgi:LAO/AO transport system kinase